MSGMGEADDRRTFPDYLNLVAGLRQATRDRTTAAVRGLLSQIGLEEAADQAAERVTRLSDEVRASSRANRELTVKLIAGEIEKFADQLGFARSDDVDDLRRQIGELRLELARLSARIEDAAAPAKKATKKASARPAKAAAKKSSTRRAAVRSAESVG